MRSEFRGKVRFPTRRAGTTAARAVRRPRLRPNMGRLKTPRARPAPGRARRRERIERAGRSSSAATLPRSMPRAWNALLARQPSADALRVASNTCAPCTPRRSAVAEHRLGAALPAARGRRRARRRLPALSQGPLVRRVRVRLGLGRRLPAPRPRLLPQAARRGAVHAGAGAAPAGDDARAAPAAAARHRGDRARGRPLLGAPAVPRRRRPGRGERGRLVDARARCSSTGRNREPEPYADFADFLASLQRDEAQEDPAGAAPRRRRRRQLHALPAASAIGADDWDFFYRCYTLTYRAHHSTPYLTRDFFAAHGADDAGSTGCCSSPGAAASADRRSLIVVDPVQQDRLRPLLGRHRVRPLPALRGLLLPAARLVHRQRLRSASKAARRASTRWRAACCRCETRSAHWLAHPQLRARRSPTSWPAKAPGIDALPGRAQRAQPVQGGRRRRSRSPPASRGRALAPGRLA